MKHGDKLNTELNKVLTNVNATKEAVSLILLGAGINEYGAKIIEQKFNNVNESIQTFLNLMTAEERKNEKVADGPF